MTRIEIATRILQGMCAGDWQMPIPEGKTWDDVAIPRAFELATKVMWFNEFGTTFETEKNND
jgi:uncharacterized protein YhjY with autotransporter beta-barrel domain